MLNPQPGVSTTVAWESRGPTESNAYSSNPPVLRANKSTLLRAGFRWRASHRERSTRVRPQANPDRPSLKLLPDHPTEKTPWQKLGSKIPTGRSPGYQAAETRSITRKGLQPRNACMHWIPKWKDNFHFGIKSLTLNPACRQLSQKNRRPNEIKCISVTKPRLSVSENPHFPRRISQRHALGESASGRVGTASTGAVSCTLCPVPCPYIRCCNASQT
jgi:hypothetical protein